MSKQNNHFQGPRNKTLADKRSEANTRLFGYPRGRSTVEELETESYKLYQQCGGGRRVIHKKIGGD